MFAIVNTPTSGMFGSICCTIARTVPSAASGCALRIVSVTAGCGACSSGA